MDETDRLAAATLVAALLTSNHIGINLTSGIDMWPQLAEMHHDCAAALAKERQFRETAR